MIRKALLRVLPTAALLTWPVLFILFTAEPAW
jgi:hypothetical protein